SSVDYEAAKAKLETLTSFNWQYEISIAVMQASGLSNVGLAEAAKELVGDLPTTATAMAALPENPIAKAVLDAAGGEIKNAGWSKQPEVQQAIAEWVQVSAQGEAAPIEQYQQAKAKLTNLTSKEY